jgi:predicted nucleic acid-binding protein
VYLLDTNIVSADRKHDPTIVAWLQSVRGRPLFLSVLTIGEIRRGVVKVLKAPAADAAAARQLDAWLARTIAEFGRNILPVDQNVARLWGDLSAGRTLPVVDALIAATALHYGLTVVTRNARDFADTGVPVLNPWDTPH